MNYRSFLRFRLALCPTRSAFSGGVAAVALLASTLLMLPLEAQPPTAASQSERRELEVDIYDNPIAPKIKVAVPLAVRPTSAPPQARKAMEEIEEVLLNDLDWSGVVEVQGPDVLKVLAVTGDRAQDFIQYRSLGNEAVVLNEFTLDGDQIVIEGRLYDLDSGRFIAGKRYAGTFDLARRLAHTWNDEIIKTFTGRAGIARTQIVFTSDRDGNQVKELYLMDYDGAGQRRITAHNSLTLSPAWSPKADGLAYASWFEGPPSLYWVDIATGQKRAVVADDTSVMTPSFSGDGREIAYSGAIRGNWEIFAVPTAGGRPRRLTNSNATDFNPAWSPNGREIAFTSDRTGRPQIYLMDRDGTNLRRLTTRGKYNEGASWHPDGTHLVYSHRSDDGVRFDIALLNLVTLEQRLLTADMPGLHEAPSFSPDGRKIVFETSKAGGSRQIFVMDANGRRLRQLTSGSHGNFGPSWSPYFE